MLPGDFPRCHRPQESRRHQDNKKRPCSPVSPRNEEFGVSMVNLLPQELDRVDNERRALPQDGEPLGVSMPSIVSREHVSDHTYSKYRNVPHNKYRKLFHHPSDQVASETDQSQSDIPVINELHFEELHTHLGRPPG